MYIYKHRYFSINHIRALVNNELWFSVGREFNDPFDCRPPLEIATTNSMIKFIQNKTKQN
jgi:hypothetical protein